MRSSLLLAVLTFASLSVLMTGTGLAAQTVVLGNPSVASLADNNSAGLGYAFSYSANASGAAESISVYVDGGSSATTLAAGLYADAGGHPGGLLASGSTDTPQAGRWDAIKLDSAPSVSSGSRYWIALLNSGGQLNIRDADAGGGGCAESSAATGLDSLPENWVSGATWHTCSLSAYVTGSTAPGPSSAPANTVPPSISGQLVQGQKLTAANGSWSGSPTSYGYQWQICDSSAASCTDVAGATSQAYTLGASDTGHTIRVMVTATNSGGSASAVSAPSAVIAAQAGGGLPAGVTLQAIDGGVNYFGQWSNSFPSPAGFYPIGVFNQTLGYNGSSYDPAQIAAYKAAGVNTFMNLYDGYNQGLIGAIRAAGMYAISEPLAAGYEGSTLAGYVWFDEADGDNDCGDVPSASVLGEVVPCAPVAGRTPPSVINQVNSDLHAADPTRPVYCQYTKPVAEDEGLTDATAAAYVNAGCGIVSYDSYIISDGWSGNHDLWRQYDDVRHVRALANYGKPVMPLIEAGEPFTTDQWSGVTATPAMSVAEAWNAIIGGARGIQWFDHDSGGGSGGYATSGDDLIDPNPVFSSLQSAVTAFDARVTGLAPILADPFAEGYVTTPAQMNVMAKYDAASGSFYVFAAPRSSDSQNATFTVAGGYTGPVTVQGENRTVMATAGKFTDTFVNATSVHVYIVPR